MVTLQYKVLLKCNRNMENKEVINTLSEIRNMMAKSTKVLSLSGISSIVVGCFALVASFIANMIINNEWPHYYKVRVLMIMSVVLFLLCFGSVLFFSKRKAEKSGMVFKFNQTVKKMLWNFFLPLMIGGIVCVGLIYQGHYGLTSSFMLLFYGLALINLSNYTFSNIKYLGYIQLILGIIDFLMIKYSLLFWALGFGISHIAYGIFFYCYIEKKNE